MKEITLEELLEAGCHFGHQVQRANPKARDFVYEEREGIQIIDLAMKKAYDDRYFLWHSKKGIYAQEKACEVLGDEIIKLEVCNEEVIETIYEKNSEEN